MKSLLQGLQINEYTKKTETDPASALIYSHDGTFNVNDSDMCHFKFIVYVYASQLTCISLLLHAVSFSHWYDPQQIQVQSLACLRQ